MKKYLLLTCCILMVILAGCGKKDEFNLTSLSEEETRDYFLTVCEDSRRYVDHVFTVNGVFQQLIFEDECEDEFCTDTHQEVINVLSVYKRYGEDDCMFIQFMIDWDSDSQAEKCFENPVVLTGTLTTVTEEDGLNYLIFKDCSMKLR